MLATPYNLYCGLLTLVHTADLSTQGFKLQARYLMNPKEEHNVFSQCRHNLNYCCAFFFGPLPELPLDIAAWARRTGAKSEVGKTLQLLPQAGLKLITCCASKAGFCFGFCFLRNTPSISFSSGGNFFKAPLLEKPSQ